MTDDRIARLLDELRSCDGGLEAALRLLAERARAVDGFVSMEDGSRIDIDRERRTGYPEVIYCPSKSVEQIVAAARALHAAHGLAFGTRCLERVAASVLEALGEGEFDSVSRTFRLGAVRPPKSMAPVAVVSAGSSDRAVAEEAAMTLTTFGVPIVRLYDAGVAGVHRLLADREQLEQCSAIIAVAGMEGALPSLLGGLVGVPIIAVPTSVGYGTAMGGLTPLFAVLTSCAAGVTVVNIDNGFGAAMAVLRIFAPRN